MRAESESKKKNITSKGYLRTNIKNRRTEMRRNDARK